MTAKPLHSGVKALLEFGPLVGFLVAYLIFRNETFRVLGTDYTGFVAVTAAFIPVFLAGIGALWLLTGKVAKIQIATAVMVVLFGGLGVWMNDPSLFKMKPTAVYLLLAFILGLGLVRGQSWLEYIMDDMVPMTAKGWNILTKRVTLLFLASAALNELVWRTQSEKFWVLFETLAMPVLIAIFFMTQIALFVDHASMKPEKPKKRRRKKA
ncbi:inner membrane-spanning protein YciB [Roseovarius aquimarinus]|uniref:Inner membrane-spanning protein YciB n=1 Tax=Roseovarius aquimarinus TaxID=1229156 RepID=A0ABW7IA03_9RHOB